MNQNQTVDNDLQKAIDDITNTTSVDPVFSDPVAAPSTIPEGDTGELGEAVGPFPEPKIEIAPPAPEPAIAQPAGMPNFAAPAVEAPAPQIMNEVPGTEAFQTETPTLNMHQVKEAALRDLIPLISKLTLEPAQKFNLYRDIFENLKDYTVLEPAYKAAKEISDENQRAEALLYLVESIDKM